MKWSRVLVPFFLIHVTAFAQSLNWGPSARDWVQNFRDHPEVSNPMRDPFIAAGWGALRAHKLFHWGLEYRGRRWLENDHFDNEKGIRVLLRAQKKRAPLIVFSPGIFNSTKDPMVLRAIRNFRRRGYHVVALPNSWSPEYIKFNPRFQPGDLEAEAKVVLQVAREAKRFIGEEKVSGVHLVGESYGAGLSAIATALDAESVDPIIDGTVTLFSPPLDVLVSMKLMDDGLDKYQSLYQEHCRGRALVSMWEVMHSRSYDDLSPKTVECAAATVAYVGFHDLLSLTARTLHKQGRVKEELGKYLTKDEIQNLRFSSFFRHFLPDCNQGILDGVGDVAKWIHRAESQGSHRIKILTTADDFLNDSSLWSRLDDLGPERLIVLPWGGHLGYIAQEGFQKFLDLSFGLQSDIAEDETER